MNNDSTSTSPHSAENKAASASEVALLNEKHALSPSASEPTISERCVAVADEIQTTLKSGLMGDYQRLGLELIALTLREAYSTIESQASEIRKAISGGKQNG